jgi:hypothetical protein
MPESPFSFSGDVFLAKGVLRELRAKGRPFGAGPGALMVVGDVGVVLSGVVMLSYPNGSFGPSLLTLYVQWYAGTRVQAGAKETLWMVSWYRLAARKQ